MSFSERKHRIESLEPRQMMAADVDLIDGVLHIEGTPNDDQVTVSQHWGLKWNGARGFSWARKIQVSASQDSTPERTSFWADDVEEIQATLGNGDDEFTNNTNKPSKVWGEGGNDTLRGGSNTDVLVGGPGNDNLYGRAGNDELWGEAGLDGLFGGRDRDQLHGGSNADRFLLDASSPDEVLDASWRDATIHFRKGNTTTNPEEASGFRFVRGTWNDADIEVVDQALTRLHHMTGNDNLLERHNGRSFTFIRQGDVTDLNGNYMWSYDTDANDRGYVDPRTGELAITGTLIGGNNDDLGNIRITNDSFRQGDKIAERNVLHEIGHSFDERHENHRFTYQFGLIDVFRAESKWRRERLQWVYDNTTDFVRNYGRTNPLEDFATTFAAYVMGSDYHMDHWDHQWFVARRMEPEPRVLAPGKFEVLDMMFERWS